MLRNAVIKTLSQLSDVLDEVQSLPHEDAVDFYCDKNAGKHIRHVLDHFYAFLPATKSGILDYNIRNRDSIIETDWRVAKAELTNIIDEIKVLEIDERNISVISEIDVSDTQNETYASNIRRELLYLINHTLHHAAYIKLLAQQSGITLSSHIGVAPSTASHLRKLGTH